MSAFIASMRFAGGGEHQRGLAARGLLRVDVGAAGEEEL